MLAYFLDFFGMYGQPQVYFIANLLSLGFYLLLLGYKVLVTPYADIVFGQTQPILPTLIRVANIAVVL